MSIAERGGAGVDIRPAEGLGFLMNFGERFDSRMVDMSALRGQLEMLAVEDEEDGGGGAAEDQEAGEGGTVEHKDGGGGGQGDPEFAGGEGRGGVTSAEDEEQRERGMRGGSGMEWIDEVLSRIDEGLQLGAAEDGTAEPEPRHPSGAERRRGHGGEEVQEDVGAEAVAEREVRDAAAQQEAGEGQGQHGSAREGGEEGQEGAAVGEAADGEGEGCPQCPEGAATSRKERLLVIQQQMEAIEQVWKARGSMQRRIVNYGIRLICSEIVEDLAGRAVETSADNKIRAEEEEAERVRMQQVQEKIEHPEPSSMEKRAAERRQRKDEEMRRLVREQVLSRQQRRQEPSKHSKAKAPRPDRAPLAPLQNTRSDRHEDAHACEGYLPAAVEPSRAGAVSAPLSNDLSLTCDFGRSQMPRRSAKGLRGGSGGRTSAELPPLSDGGASRPKNAQLRSSAVQNAPVHLPATVKAISRPSSAASSAAADPSPAQALAQAQSLPPRIHKRSKSVEPSAKRPSHDPALPNPKTQQPKKESSATYHTALGRALVLRHTFAAYLQYPGPARRRGGMATRTSSTGKLGRREGGQGGRAGSEHYASDEFESDAEGEDMHEESRGITNNTATAEGVRRSESTPLGSSRRSRSASPDVSRAISPKADTLHCSCDLSASRPSSRGGMTALQESIRAVCGSEELSPDGRGGGMHVLSEGSTGYPTISKRLRDKGVGKPPLRPEFAVRQHAVPLAVTKV